MADKKRVYRNTTNQTLNLMGFGVVEPGQEITTDEEINNSNFEEVKQPKPKK
jgi:hypothetical protein